MYLEVVTNTPAGSGASKVGSEFVHGELWGQLLKLQILQVCICYYLEGNIQ
jgi:hypothetical protein